jgi:hypothetical protein
VFKLINLSNEQLASLRIKQFIFHVVHHGEPEPVLFNELEIGEFEPFFLDRVRSILKGTAYEFNPQADVCGLLEAVKEDSSLFVDHSRQLAVNFHAHGLDDKRIKKGVMILMSLVTLDKELFSIIKFEHEQVLRYRNDGSSVFLESVADTFTQSPDAMQKAAVIDMSEEDPVVMVLDRNVRGGISGFFQGFLNVRRAKSEKEKTETLLDVVRNTSNQHLDDFPPDFTREVQSRADEFLQNGEQFDNEEFFTKVFGPDVNDSVRNTYKHYIQKEDLENEQFYLDKDAASVPKKRKIRTAEGLTIYFNEKSASSIKISYGQNGEKDMIVIESMKVREEM